MNGSTIRELIDWHAKETPDRVILIDPDAGQQITCRMLQDSAQSIAATVASRGVKPGESVAYAMTNGVMAAQIILSIMYGGYRATAVNLVAGNQVLEYVLGHSGAKLIFHHDATGELISGILGPHDNRLINADDVVFDRDRDAIELHVPQGTDDGLLMYTSGTTGVPKGVVLTQQNLLAGGHNAMVAHGLTNRDRGLCVLPLYHINGLCVTLLGALVSGGSVVIPYRFSVSQFWNTIRNSECTWFSVVPTQISYLLQRAEEAGVPELLTGLRFGRSASAPLSPDVQEAFEGKFGIPIIETMGLTETAAQILSNPMPSAKRKIGSPGLPVGNEVIIADERQVEVPRGCEGEVLVRGDNVMRGYLDNDEATRAAITPQGWLRTGDLGRMDDEGYVFIAGRLKELIIKGGENIAPREVDDALYSHQDVVEAAAFGCDCPDYGQRVEAGVMLAEGSRLTEAELISICRDRIGAFKAPDKVHFFSELPKGPSGKIQRMKLADMLR